MKNRKIKLYFVTNRVESIYNLTWSEVLTFKKLGYPRHGTMEGLEKCKNFYLLDVMG
jgi:hypothetical protein